MKRKIDLTSLKYSFRSWYLRNCMVAKTQPRYMEFRDKVAAESGSHYIRVSRLMTAKKGDKMTATASEIAAFSRILNVPEDFLAEGAVPGERVVVQ